MTNEFNRYYISSRAILGIDTKTIYEQHTQTLGSYALSYPTVRRLAKYFDEGRDDVNDEYRSGRPASILTNENILRVRQLIEDGPYSSYNDIITEGSLSHVTIERVTHGCLKMRKVTLPWVAHKLNDEQKQERLRVCRRSLEKSRSRT